MTPMGMKVGVKDLIKDMVESVVSLQVLGYKVWAVNEVFEYDCMQGISGFVGRSNQMCLVHISALAIFDQCVAMSKKWCKIELW